MSQRSTEYSWLKPTVAEKEFLQRLKFELMKVVPRDWTITFRKGENLHYKDYYVVSDGNGEARIAFVKPRARLTIEFVARFESSHSKGAKRFTEGPKNGFRWKKIIEAVLSEVQKSWKSDKRRSLDRKKYEENRGKIETLARQYGFEIDDMPGRFGTHNVITPSAKERNSYRIQLYKDMDNLTKEQVEKLLERLTLLGVIP